MAFTDGDGKHGTALRLYDLLATLVAMRMDFGTNTEGEAAAHTLGPEKISDIQVLLDLAISPTKDIIGVIQRPLA